MTQELTAARRALSRVSSDLKQGQFISAATSVRDAARLFGRVPMMKSEQEEFSALLQSTAELLYYNKDLAKIFPLAITYAQGKEEELGDLMNELIEALQEASTEEARLKHKAYKEAQLAKGQKELREGSYDEARRTLGQLGDDYSDDGETVAEIGELFSSVGLNEDAHRYMQLAVSLLPESAHVLNRFGIVLRKLKRLDESEAVFDRAVQIEQGDPNLFFNQGRLYVDRQQWDKALECARKALALAPEFREAGKMAAYAEKQVAQS